MVKNNAFFFDLDGTLLGKNKELSKNTIKYIKKLKQNNEIGIATGRPAYMIKKQINQINPTLPVISANGALVTDNNGNFKNPIYVSYFDLWVQLKIISKLKELSMNFLAYSQNGMFYHDPYNNSSRCKWIKRLIKKYDESERLDFKDINNQNLLKLKLIKFLVLIEESSSERKGELTSFINAHPEIHGVCSEKKLLI